jgi:tetratricopeptide (TPR) repeat protein
MLPDLPAFRVEPALRGLLDQSLTELVPASVRCLRTHQVLLDSVARTIDSNQREPIAAAAARLLLVVLPEVPEHGPQDPRVTLLAPHLLAFMRRVATWGLQDSVVEAAAECVLRLVIAIHRSGDYASALTLTGEAVELAAPRLGTDNVLILRLNQRIGCALFRLGRFEESEVIHRRVLEQCERTLGAEAPDTLESCRQLGRAIFNVALLDLGQFRDCVALLERAVAGRTELFGKTHPLTLLARADLVEFAIGPGMDGIVATGPEVIADSRRALGEDHRITLQAEHSYASTLIYIGRGREALPYARRVFASYERSLGPDHTGTLSARQALSRALAAAGDYAEAIAHIEAVIERRTIILGPGHPWTSVAREHLNEYRQSQSNASPY